MHVLGQAFEKQDRVYPIISIYTLIGGPSAATKPNLQLLSVTASPIYAF